MDLSNPLITILGPTSSGKTSLALKLCKEFKGEIVSADSRQIFKYMDIGTGKIPTNKNSCVLKKFNGYWVVNGVRINCYDIAHPDNNFSVVDFAKKAEIEIKRIWQERKVPFLVGGTGFYIDVLCGKVKLSGAKPDLERRGTLKETPLEKLLEKLRNLNPQKFEQVDKKNKIRVIRALEIELDKKKNLQLPALNFKFSPTIQIGLTSSRHVIYKKVDGWVDFIFKNGLLQEVRNLIKMGFKNTMPMQGLIYNEVLEHLDNKKSLQEIKEAIKFDLHSYVRRQLTWFNRNSEINWLDYTDYNLYLKTLKLIESNYGK